MPDDAYAVRVAVAVPVAVGCALVGIAVSTPPAASLALPLAAYWLVAEPLLWSPAGLAVRLRGSAIGRRVGSAVGVRTSRGQRTLRAVGLALLAVGPTTTLLRELGVGAIAPYIGLAIGLLVIVAEFATGDADDVEENSVGRSASGSTE